MAMSPERRTFSKTEESTFFIIPFCVTITIYPVTFLWFFRSCGCDLDNFSPVPFLDDKFLECNGVYPAALSFFLSFFGTARIDVTRSPCPMDKKLKMFLTLNVHRYKEHLSLQLNDDEKRKACLSVEAKEFNPKKRNLKKAGAAYEAGN